MVWETPDVQWKKTEKQNGSSWKGFVIQETFDEKMYGHSIS